MGAKTTYKSLLLTEGQYDIVQKINAKNAFYNVMCCSRQFGKSTLLGQLMLNDSINSPHSKLLYAAPIYAQAKKQYTDLFNLTIDTPLIKEHHKGDLFIKLINGSEIKFVGVENYDALRGLAINYMYLDEFQFMKSGAWQNALRPMLTVAGKKCYIASTPRQQGTLFHEMYVKGLGGDDNYFSVHKNYLDNPLANLQEVEDARLNLPELIFRCEYLGEFIQNGSEVFRGIDNAATLQFRPPNPGEKVFAGLDLARQKDYTVLTIINDRGEVLFIYRDQKKDWNDIVYNIIRYLKQYNVKKCLVEANSIGDVVLDLLRKGGANNIIESFYTDKTTKPDLIESLIVSFENGAIRIPTQKEFPALYNELQVFSYVYNPNSRSIKYGAPVGFHDDCVMSLALANKIIKDRNARTSPSFHSINLGGETNNDYNNW